MRATLRLPAGAGRPDRRIPGRRRPARPTAAMTQIDFYFQVDDKIDFARRLCLKALASRSRLLVWSPDEAASQKLSRLLWSFPSTGFLPHCLASDPLAARTPIVLDHASGPFPHDEVLMNLRQEVPPFFSRFRRMIEIVSAIDEDDKREARRRFKHYRDRGYELRTHDMAKLLGAAL
jgi:DNA polymerase-3 subunit chi